MRVAMNMGESFPLPNVALIAGPTASGKSALALALAKSSNGVIINADASQLYADLTILSARPTATELAQAPHHLFGTIDGAMACSAAAWAELAKAEIAAALAAGQLPILVGGTGLYLRALLDGIATIPAIPAELRSAVRGLDGAAAYQALQAEDPLIAGRLHPNDRQRVLRALEVIRATGRSLAAWQADTSGGITAQIALAAIILLPPRDWLRQQIAQRFARMIDRGAVDEVAQLLARKLAPDLPVLRAIGVAEIAGYLTGTLDHETMLTRGQIASMQYAKRQYTWLRHQAPATWPRYATQLDNEENINHVILLLKKQLTH
jgi:tRNA dimethylallyltransferase